MFICDYYYQQYFLILSGCRFLTDPQIFYDEQFYLNLMHIMRVTPIVMVFVVEHDFRYILKEVKK